MSTFKLEFPEDFDDYEWEVESKGFLGNIQLQFDRQSYLISFYDKERLMQEIVDEIESNGFFFESNLIIIDSVTKANMVESIERLVKTSEIKGLKPR